MKTRILPALVLPLALSLPLGGCFSVLPEPQIPSALIALPAERAQAPADPLRADVAVYPPDSHARLRRRRHRRARSDQEMVYLADVRWVDFAAAPAPDAVVDSLSEAGGEGAPSPPSSARRSTTTCAGASSICQPAAIPVRSGSKLRSAWSIQ